MIFDLCSNHGSCSKPIAPVPEMVRMPVERSKLHVRFSPQVPLSAAQAEMGSSDATKTKQSMMASSLFFIVITSYMGIQVTLPL